MIQVDIDEENLGRTKAAALTVMADAQVFLAELNRRLRATKGDIKLEERGYRGGCLQDSLGRNNFV